MALTKAKRVEVAKEVLRLVRAKKFLVEEGLYFFPNNYIGFYDREVGRDLGDVVREEGTRDCVVCARGAAVLAKASLWDDFKVVDEMGVKVVNESARMFGKKQCAMIESAFEGSEIGLPKDVLKKCHKFHYKYDDPTKRLQAIMRNVIRNGGVFVP